jgi:hypothetical protein
MPASPVKPSLPQSAGEVFFMMSTISGAVVNGAGRGKPALLGKAIVQRFVKAPILDWVIPPTLAVIIVVAFVWIAFFAE